MPSKKRIKKVIPKKFRIFGIFNFETNDLVYVNMDQEMTELEFDMENYDLAIYDIVSFECILTP